GLPYVAPRYEPTGLHGEVDEEGRVAHRRRVEWNTVWLRDQVFVRNRDHGGVDPGEAADLMREDPARVHDDLGLDVPPVRDDSGDSVAIDLDRCDARVGVNLR